ncbi:Ino eighty subunit 1 [Trametes pubescens]|uniref:Ino eighty subunit 1 n=1 Tax=Trametes pubescens TaxID=154538 RepID=A0A1M2VYN5_TRAPU|nr:Ino eighty subunit 1 [Trametes pubescens]
MASSSSADRYAANIQGWNIQQVNTPPQYLGRKTLPIKRTDAEPLNREDLQYDLLYFIFADTTKAFVDHLAPNHPIVNFCDLYVNALYNSPKCSKVLKDKMVDTPAFAIEFAKIALLTNVGRINTTMAFFPEMKTALRSYHPVPSLQKTDGNLQDAPRIKNCLKAALLPFEFKTPPPSSPAEILEKARAGHIPPTSVVNLIFVLSNSNHAMTVAQKHFDPPVEFLDLFLPINLSSASRARVFLWIMYHYLTGPDRPNPFDDDYSRANPGRVPRMRPLSREEQAQENIDPVDEIEWGKRMSAQRSKFLRELVDEMEMEKRRKKNPLPPPPPMPSTSYSAQEMAVLRQARYAASEGPGSRGSSHSHESRPLAQSSYASTSRPLPQLEPFRGDTTGEDPTQERTMLNQAWHVINTADPLEDSDKEGDDHVRLEYNRRLRVLARLRGKEPTPEPEMQQGSSSGGQGDAGTGRLQHVQSWR